MKVAEVVVASNLKLKFFGQCMELTCVKSLVPQAQISPQAPNTFFLDRTSYLLSLFTSEQLGPMLVIIQ
jgi:hypothetical protein